MPKLKQSSTISLSHNLDSKIQINGTNPTEYFSDSVIFMSHINLTKTSAKFRRFFMKIQDLISQVGGFIKGIMIFFNF